MEGKRPATSRDYEIISKPMVFVGIEAALRTGSRGERGGYWLEPAFDGVAASFEQPLISAFAGGTVTAFKLLLRKRKGTDGLRRRAACHYYFSAW